MPGVDLVVGVVCHEGEGAVCKGEYGAWVWFALHGAGGDATCGGCDVVCEDGEVFGGVGVGGPVESVFVESAGAAFAVEDAVYGLYGGDVCGADAAMVDDACGGGCEALSGGGGGDDPLAVFCAEHDDFSTGEEPADVCLCGGGHGEVEGGGV